MEDLISRKEISGVIRSMRITLGGRDIFPSEAKRSVLDAIEAVDSVEIIPVKDGHCKYCNDGSEVVPFVFADDEEQRIHYADYCPICGRDLT